MDIRTMGKFSNIAQDIKLSFLVILAVASVILLHLNFRKKENTLMQELKANERERAELKLRLNHTLESIEPLRESIEPIKKSIEPLRESIEPLKTEIENLKKVFETQRNLAQAKEQEKEQAKTNEIAWPVSANPLSEGSGGIKPLPKALSIAPAVPFLGGEPSPALIPQAGKAEEGLSHLKDYIQSIEQENAILKKRSDDLNALLNAKAEEIARLSRDNPVLKQDLQNSLDSQNKLREELNQISQELSRQKADSDGLQKKIAQIDNELAQKEKEKAGLSSESAKLREELSTREASFKAQLSAKENEARQLVSQKTNFETRVAELAARIDALTKANNELQKQLSSKERDNSSLTRELNRISQELSRQKAESDGLQKKIAQIDNELVQKEKEKAALSSEQARLKQEMASQVKQKEAEIKEGRDEIAFLKKELENLFQTRKSISSDLQDKEKIISILSDELALVRSDLKKQGIGQSKETQEANAALKQRLAEVMQELELLKLEKSSKR